MWPSVLYQHLVTSRTIARLSSAQHWTHSTKTHAQVETRHEQSIWTVYVFFMVFDVSTRGGEIEKEMNFYPL